MRYRTGTAVRLTAPPELLLRERAPSLELRIPMTLRPKRSARSSRDRSRCPRLQPGQVRVEVPTAERPRARVDLIGRVPGLDRIRAAARGGWRLCDA